jgi:pimeloyl-ACP methyl ester carboxylesterase
MVDDIAKVIRFEQRACGRSTVDYDCDLETTLADLEVIREYYNVPAWIIAGHS